MASRADSIAESSKTITLEEKLKLEQLSEDECQERIKIHQEKARRCLEAAQIVSLLFAVQHVMLLIKRYCSHDLYKEKKSFFLSKLF